MPKPELRSLVAHLTAVWGVTPELQSHGSHRRSVAPLLTLLLLVVGHSGFAQDAGTNRGISCSPPAGTRSLWERAGVRFLVVGELHGTRETPGVFGELVCSATTEARKRILVALEFPEAARAAFEAYMASKGTDEDQTKFLAQSGWLDMARSGPDGRTSEAMFKMVERLRALRAAGRNISVTTFQRPDPTQSESQTPYEIGLADSVQKAFASGDYDLTMVLVGSLHASRMTITPGGWAPFNPMAMHLPKDSTLTLDAVTGAGEAWNCQSTGCGAHKRESQPHGVPSGVVLDDKLSPGYDGVIGIGPITASPPIRSNQS